MRRVIYALEEYPVWYMCAPDEQNADRAIDLPDEFVKRYDRIMSEYGALQAELDRLAHPERDKQ